MTWSGGGDAVGRPVSSMSAPIVRASRLQSLVVGNPTGDLDFAALEAQRVAARLRAGGFEARLLETEHGTERDISEAPGRRVGVPLHWARSVRDVPSSTLGTGGAPGCLVARRRGRRSAAGAGCRRRLAADAGQRAASPTSLTGAACTNTCIRSPIGSSFGSSPATGRPYGDAYVWEDDEEGRYGRCLRLAELLTAGDLLQEKALQDCRFVFLSSCNAGRRRAVARQRRVRRTPGRPPAGGRLDRRQPAVAGGRGDRGALRRPVLWELASAAGEVDVPALIEEVRGQMRRMDARKQPTASKA